MRQLRRLSLVGVAIVAAFVVLSAFASASPTQRATPQGSTAPPVAGNGGAVAGRISAANPLLSSHVNPTSPRAALAQGIMQKIRAAGVPMTAAYLPNLMGQARMVNGLVSPLYTVGPAPMGIGDFGVRNVTGTPVGYTLQSTSWQGVITLNSINALYLDSGVPDWFGVQLNAVMDNTTVGKVTTNHYWIQNVIQYSTLTNSLTFLDNIWNFSNPSASEPAGTFYSYCPSGNGGPVPPVFYYCFGPTFTVPFPFTVHLYVNSSLTINVTANKAWSTVRFGYNILNGAGASIHQGTYDTVLFNSNVSATPIPPPTPKFTVNGLAFNPAGLLDDSEIVIAGPGGGSTITVYAINGTEQLQYLDSVTGRYASDPTAWNEGTDTGETAEGISEYYTTAGTVGLSLGPSIPMPFWNATPTGNIGKSVVQGKVTPSNSFFFFNQGAVYNEAQAAWAPVPSSGQYSWAVPPGTYFVRTLASEYAPNATSMVLAAGVHAYNVPMAPNRAYGVYAPLWAWTNGQIANISSAGGGTATNPYLLDNNQYGALDSVFGELNDFFFPVFSGIFLGYTNAYVDINQAASLYVVYPASYDPALARFGLPNSNNLAIQAYYASSISIWQSSISGWTSGFLFFGGIFAPIGDIGFWGVTNSLIGQNFISDQGSALLTAMGGNNVIWGNTIVLGSELPSYYGAGFTLGIQVIEGNDLIYNNIVTTTIPAYAPNMNFYTGAPQINRDSWNLSGAEPASQVKTVNGYNLWGSSIGSPWQCGNLWGNYAPGARLPYNDTGFIGTGGDFCPYPLRTYPVTFTESGLPGGTWSVSLADLRQSAAAGSAISFQAPNGTWSFSAGAVGHTATPSAGTASVTGAPTNVAISMSGALVATPLALPAAADVGVNVAFFTSPVGGTGSYSYSWAFGDGGTSALQNPGHAYTAAGSYPVTSVVTDSSGDSVSHQITVTVNAYPTIALSPATASTDVSLPLTFTATASGGTAPSIYSWDWNDGTNSVAITGSGSHRFSLAGTYNVHVTVVDAGGGTATGSAAVTVSALPTVDVSASSGAPVTGDAVTFTSTVTGGTSAFTYAWDFGDASTSTAASPSHSFATAGPFTVKVTVTDAAGGVAHATVKILAVAPFVTTTSAIGYSVGAFVVGIAIAAVVLTLLARRKKQGPAEPPAPPPPPSAGP
jgi:PKD repeat protein